MGKKKPADSVGEKDKKDCTLNYSKTKKMRLVKTLWSTQIHFVKELVNSLV